jgi:hypothetical protein
MEWQIFGIQLLFPTSLSIPLKIMYILALFNTYGTLKTYKEHIALLFYTERDVS